MESDVLKDILSEIRMLREQTEPVREVLTLEEAANYLRLSPHTLREKTRLRQIPFYKMGGSIRFRRSKLNSWIDRGEIAIIE